MTQHPVQPFNKGLKPAVTLALAVVAIGLGLILAGALASASLALPSSSRPTASAQAALTTTTATTVDASCAGCEKRENGEDGAGDPEPWTWSYNTAGGCTVSFRERYTSYSEKCHLTLTSVCSQRTCSFTWKLQVKDSGGTNCNGNTITVKETVPPASPKTVTTTSSYKNIISPVQESDVVCGYETQRTGIINEGLGHQKEYDFTIGCQDCLAGGPPQ